MRVLFCEGCGAPMDAPWSELVVICQHCDAHNVPGQPGAPVPQRVPVDGRPRVNLGGRTYVVESRLAEGDSSVVYRARWVVRLGELVVLKVQQAEADADLLRNEWEVLSALSSQTTDGGAHFVTRLPRPIAHGLITTDRARVASVFGWSSGFSHTLTAVGEHYAGGVPGEAVVWLLKRLLELLGFVHRQGFVHGAVTPDHILVQPRDHGAMLVGWTAAGRAGRRLTVRSRTWKALYPSERATPSLDLIMACRCVQAVAGWQLPETLKHPALQDLLERGIRGQYTDAWALADDLVAVSRQTFGPPGYHPLELPGWRHDGVR